LEKIGDLPKIESLSGSVKDYLKNKVLLNLHFNLFLVFHSVYIKLPQSLFCSISSLDLFEFDLVHFPPYIHQIGGSVGSGIGGSVASGGAIRGGGGEGGGGGAKGEIRGGGAVEVGGGSVGGDGSIGGGVIGGDGARGNIGSSGTIGGGIVGGVGVGGGGGVEPKAM